MKTRARYEFGAFIAPDCYWPHPYTYEQAFGVLRWMLATGGDEKYHVKGRWGTHTVAGFLLGKASCVGILDWSFPGHEIKSLGAVEDRLHNALLSRCTNPGVRRWREDFGISPAGRRIIKFPVTRGGPSEHEMLNVFIDLFGAKGKLRPLNKCHRKATTAAGVHILPSKHGWRFVLRYGYARDHFSYWHHLLAEQARGERFYAALLRAQAALVDVSDPTKGVR